MKKIIVITGGSDGLGKATAKLLSAQNTVVILSDNEQRLKQASKELSVEGYLCDVCDYSLVDEVISKINKKYGRIDVLINNAGVWIEGPLDENEYAAISKTMAVNAVGPIFATRAVLPIMKERKQGHIINIISQAGYSQKADRAVYYASKWALAGFTRCLEIELAPFGIKITGVYPYKMKTKLFEKAGTHKDMTKALDPEEVAKALEFAINSQTDVLVSELHIKNPFE